MPMNIIVRNTPQEYVRVALKKQEVVNSDIGFEYIPDCGNLKSAVNWVTSLSA